LLASGCCSNSRARRSAVAAALLCRRHQSPLRRLPFFTTHHSLPIKTHANTQRAQKPGLYMGGAEALAQVDALGITHVVVR
jgi:hypothetical protein